MVNRTRVEGGSYNGKHDIVTSVEVFSVMFASGVRFYTSIIAFLIQQL